MAVLAAPAAMAQSAPAPIVGQASAVDSDIIAIGDARVVLFGLESVEQGQMCAIGGQAWDCYPAAVRALELLLSFGDVSCTIVGERDAFGRALGICEVAGLNLNEEYVRSGFALARRSESLDYVAAEDAARAEGIGLWQGQFQNPADYRAERGIDDRP